MWKRIVHYSFIGWPEEQNKKQREKQSQTGMEPPPVTPEKDILIKVLKSLPCGSWDEPGEVEIKEGDKTMEWRNTFFE